MLQFDGEYKLYLMLALAVMFALTLLIVRRKRKAKGTYRLERDSTGFWRYHPDSQFQRQMMFHPERKGKRRRKKKGHQDSQPRAVAVIEFNGDLRGKGHTGLARLIDEVEVNKDQIEEVVITVNSPGGMVPTYGHAFSEIERIRNLEIPLTVCIDVVAASGGYLMSLPANKIIAAPFSFVGSIGVLAFVPNFRNLLQRWDINPRTFTAGRYKRTVSFTDQATPEDVARFQGQLEAVHRLFLDAVKKYRPQAKMEEVETGDHWTAQEAVDKELGLIDALGTSRSYLLERNREADLLLISRKQGFLEGSLGLFMSAFFARTEEAFARWSFGSRL